MDGLPLAELVREGSEEAVLKALAQMSPESVVAEITNGEFGNRGARSALHCAAQCGRAAILRIFLAYEGVNPSLVDDAFNTPLHFAVEAGHARAAHVLLKAGAKARAGNGFGKMPVQLAEEQAWDTAYVKSGKVHIRRMLEGVFDPYDSLPPEPGDAAAAGAHREKLDVPMASQLLDRECGLKAHYSNRRGSAPSIYSGTANAAGVPQVQGAAPAAAGGRRASAPSIVDCALAGDEPQLLAELVKSGSIGLVETRLQELLIDKGPEAVRTEVMNCEEGLHDTRIAQSALHVAARRGYADMLRTLLSTNASPNVTNDQWNTPLHLAAESGKAQAVEVLLEAGADPMIRNSFGRSAEELAFVKQFDPQEVAQGKSAIQKLLRKLVPSGAEAQGLATL